MSDRQTVFALIGAMLAGAMLVGAGVVAADVATDDVQAQTAAPSADGTSEITVAASGDAAAQPDKAMVRVSIEASAVDPTTARTRVAENASSMKRALIERLDLNESRIRTVDYALYQDEVRGRESGERPETVYRARHTFAVEIDDIGRVGRAIDVAVDNGATNVHDVEFTLSAETRNALRREALRNAMASARDQAGTLAESSDLTITGVSRVSTTDVGIPRHEVALAANAGGAGGTDIETGPVTVRASVSVTFNATAG